MVNGGSRTRDEFLEGKSKLIDMFCGHLSVVREPPLSK